MGRYSCTRTPRPATPLEVELESEAASNGSGGVTPAGVRPALAQAAADELETITAVLIDAATNATRPVWTTPCCPECGAQFRQEVHVPDHKARVSAVEVLLREGLGRPAQAEDSPKPRLPESEAAIQSMGWRDLQHWRGGVAVGELLAVQRDGGERLLRDRVGALTADQRRALQDALEQAA